MRDNLGRFITIGVPCDVGLLSTIEGEAMTLREALQGVISLQLNNVTFESDSQLVVQVIHSKYLGRSEFSLIILSIKSLLHLFSNFEVKFIKRQADSVAHTLAKVVNS